MPKYVACIHYRPSVGSQNQNSLLIVEAHNEDQASALLDVAMDHANLLDLLPPGEKPVIRWTWNRLKELDGRAVMRKQEERKNRQTPHPFAGMSPERMEQAIANEDAAMSVGVGGMAVDAGLYPDTPVMGCPPDAVCGGPGCIHEGVMPSIGPKPKPEGCPPHWKASEAEEQAKSCPLCRRELAGGVAGKVCPHCVAKVPTNPIIGDTL